MRTYLTQDGETIAGGYSFSGISGEKTQANRGPNYTTDFWIVKVDRAGKIEWDKTIGGSNNDYLYSLQQTDDGGYILGGGSESDISGEKTDNDRITLNRGDFWIVKLDSLGNIEWDKTIGGGDIDYLVSLQQTKDGGYILSGDSGSDISGEKTENSRGDLDYWVVKLNSQGEIEWDKTLGGNSVDQVMGIQETSDGGYILGGFSFSDLSGEESQNGRGSADYWVIKLDNAGNIQWDKTIGGSNTDYLGSLQETNDGGYILGGSSYSDISGEKTQHSRGGSDFWVDK